MDKTLIANRVLKGYSTKKIRHCEGLDLSNFFVQSDSSFMVGVFSGAFAMFLLGLIFAFFSKG